MIYLLILIITIEIILLSDKPPELIGRNEAVKRILEKK